MLFILLSSLNTEKHLKKIEQSTQMRENLFQEIQSCIIWLPENITVDIDFPKSKIDD